MACTIRAIRGAVQVDADDPDLIGEATRELVAAALDWNGLGADDVISILFTMTPDLCSHFPAATARAAGLDQVPVMCATEIAVPHALPRVIRLMAHAESTRSKAQIRHPYLRGAAVLRPDLALPAQPR